MDSRSEMAGMHCEKAQGRGAMNTVTRAGRGSTGRATRTPEHPGAADGVRRLVLWSILLPVLVALLFPPALAVAQDNNEETCPDAGTAPTPVEVAVTAVPIVVSSTPDDYFVLYVTHEVDGTEGEIPVLVKRGEAGTTTLAENIEALPPERYRVEKYAVATPADVDGDCIDDLTELEDLGTKNPVNPAAIDPSDGAVAIPDRRTYETLVYTPPHVGWKERTFLKFVILDIDTDRPRVYVQNTEKHQHHTEFLNDVLDHLDLDAPGLIRGQLGYLPDLAAPNGSLGVYYYASGLRRYSFSTIARAYTLLAASMPLLKDNLAYWIPHHALPAYQNDLPLFKTSRIPLVFDDDIYLDIDFIGLNPAVGYGTLRVMEPDDRPHPRDIVLYEALPNNLPRVAGIISTVPQTPLSHVNLRAVQDGIPNAFIRDALDKSAITALLNGPVRYEVEDHRYTIRAADPDEVDAHYESSRPAEAQTPQRDLLSVTKITPLSEIGFADWRAFGVKAANVAELRKLEFPEGTVPDGFAIPFSFYDEFMEHNGLYDAITEMLGSAEFQTDPAGELKKLRRAIEGKETPGWIIEGAETETPDWIIAEIVKMNESFAEGVNKRYRSSTNNEDLPGFNGAGLYDSKSQKPSEDETDLAKSLKEVYASLWNFRAFTEREFHRIDHLATAMGVLVHPSYQDELVNGVAVSFDPIRGSDRDHYVNSQVGEDLVTNPEAHSVPEELLLTPAGRPVVLATSNLAEPGQLLMKEAQLRQLREHLEVIHGHFKGLYTPAAGDPFAMEIEFKITRDDILAIKQARPWVFAGAAPVTRPPVTRPPVIDDSGSDGPGSSGPGGGSSGGTGSSPGSPSSSNSGSSGGGGSGAGRVQDQHGNSPARSTPLPLEAPSWTTATAGQLNPADDVDYFTLTVAQAGVLVVETTGSTATQGTVWQDEEELVTADSGGARQNFRLRVPVEAGPVVVAVAGNGRRTGAYTLETTLLVGFLENPGAASFQSGIGVLSGWVCAAEEIVIEIETENGEVEQHGASYGTERLDTERVCGDTDNGFGLLFNWNRLGDGEHAVVAWVDEVELGRATLTVTTLGEEFVEDVAGSCEVADFPMAGETVTLVWQESNQNFVIASGDAPEGTNAATSEAVVGYLENPGPNSFQSGIGVISGWVCEAEAVEIEIEAESGETERHVAGYGTERADTEEMCGDTDNGFGLLFNWNHLGDGEHAVVVRVDEVELGRATVRVTTLGQKFLRGAEGECVVADFPMSGETVTLEWQQTSQNFVITGVE